MATTKTTRSVLKHSYIRASNKAKSIAKAHVAYIAYRPDQDGNRESRTFFNNDEKVISPKDVCKRIDEMNEHGTLIHKFILSPGVDDVDMEEYTRGVMKRLGQEKGLELEYWAVIHDNTEHKHVHIVVAGLDKERVPVRIYKKDHAMMREEGDRIMASEIEPEPSPEFAPRRNPFNFFLDKLASFGLPIRRNREKVEAASTDENCSFGDEPNKDKVARARELREEKRKAELNREVLLYESPVPTVYNSSTTKKEIQQLINEYDQGQWRDQIGRKERKRLGEWLKWKEESSSVDRKAYSQGHRIKWLEIQSNSVDSKTYSRDSSVQELEDLKDKHGKGKIVLTPSEEKAIKIWLGEKQRQVPVSVPLKSGETLTCLPSDNLNTLEAAARASNKTLSDGEHKRLWCWIFQKRMQKNINHSISVNSPLGPLEFNRSDKKEHLQFLADKYRAPWATEQLSKDEYDRLRTWLKEKNEREPEI